MSVYKMPVNTKYDKDEKKGTNASRGLWAALIGFGSAIGLLFATKTKPARKKPASSNSESFNDQIRNLDLKNAPEEVFKNSLLAHKVFFLNRMISGDFNDLTPTTLRTQREKEFYAEFSKLSHEQRKSQYIILENQLMATAL